MMLSNNLKFWKLARKHPNLVYDLFISNKSWKVFRNGLPDNYREIVPFEHWDGPFRLSVPILGNKVIHVFGKIDTYEKSQRGFVDEMKTNLNDHLESIREKENTLKQKKPVIYFLNRAGDLPYRDLVRKHYKSFSAQELQYSVLMEESLLPDSFQDQTMNYIDEVGYRLGYDQDFWKNATCNDAFKKIIRIANSMFPLREFIMSKKDAFTEPNQKILFSLFQIPTLSFAYTARLDKKMRKLFGIKKFRVF